MNVIAFANRKGGSGKSTLAVHLAVQAETPEAPALLIDTDPQGSLVYWGRLRKAKTPVVVRAETGELSDILEAARREDVKWVFIDTQPHHTQEIANAMSASSLVVVPLRPALFDVAAVAATLEVAKLIGVEVLPVINSAPARRGIAQAPAAIGARRALMGLGVTPWSGQITIRSGFATALAEGLAVQEVEPDGPAAKEVQALWAEVRSRLQ